MDDTLFWSPFTIRTVRWVNSIPDSTWEEKEVEDSRRGSSGRAVGYQVRGPEFESQSGPNQFIIAPPCLPSTK
ncbi:hypothetical protein PoB_002085700 [Plakobranchus ocellatus]|uniref:Uncharacterized protein n=1 Tax=Plakobranchus ocellatus TaxID=259542 RepID=A0AAV3ZGB5_9GAST|nr:hypothetical protein PoB_002085700 [Plakobranchus ocellatus]